LGAAQPLRPAPARLASLALALLLPAAAAAQECVPDALDLRDQDTALRFRVEVMDDAAERAQGLMFRESMPEFSGMLFVYETPQPVAFWMRNTLIPLDMLFFDPAGRLTRIKSNAVPRDETPIPGGDNIRYVLEINGGLAESLGIDVGAEIRHPALDQAAAAWPCG
jgi:uncharacterized membrane protein (UPF0127 family)